MQQYELVEQIGKGSYGVVLTARNHQDKQLYVIKRVPVDDSSRSDADAALREANVLSSLRHPHIVPYKEFFNHDGDLCLVMAFCEGGDLFNHIKQARRGGKPISEKLTWQWLVQLLLALSYCHSKKILHRDVKTQSHLLNSAGEGEQVFYDDLINWGFTDIVQSQEHLHDQDGKLMMGDFGLAKQLQRTLEMARTPIGTPYYMAPEIYEEAPYSFKSDVWALGCVMYEAMTGKPAFAADNLCRVVIRVLKGTYDALPTDYSAELRSIVGLMLTREVKKRPSANELLQHPFVVPRVQAYLDELSKAGGQAGWSTWRMNLPPGLLVQAAGNAAGVQNCELQVLKSQMSAVRSSTNGKAAAHDVESEEEDYEDDFESDDEHHTSAAAQLLGMLERCNLHSRPSADATLNAGFPKAAIGFGAKRDPSSSLPAPGHKHAGHRPPSSPGSNSPSSSAGRGSGRLPPLAQTPNFSFKPGQAASPASPQVPVWHARGTSLAKGQFAGACTSINLQATLTNRAVFLRKELQLQLGAAGLEAACAVVRSLHDANHGEPVKDMKLREALSGVVSPAHQELAPLLDEFVLLQKRSYHG